MHADESNGTERRISGKSVARVKRPSRMNERQSRFERSRTGLDEPSLGTGGVSHNIQNAQLSGHVGQIPPASLLVPFDLRTLPRTPPTYATRESRDVAQLFAQSHFSLCLYRRMYPSLRFDTFPTQGDYYVNGSFLRVGMGRPFSSLYCTSDYATWSDEKGSTSRVGQESGGRGGVASLEPNGSCGVECSNLTTGRSARFSDIRQTDQRCGSRRQLAWICCRYWKRC
jgi:hypothetical protein